MTDATLTRNTDLDVSDEQQHFVQALRDFCAREKDLGFEQTAERMAELGWWGLNIDEAYGGSEGSFFDATLFLEETSRGLSEPAGAYGVTLIVVGQLNSRSEEDDRGRANTSIGRCAARSLRSTHGGIGGRQLVPMGPTV